MENKLNIIEHKLSNIELSHPNLFNIWKKYLDIKKKTYTNALNECDIFLDKIKDVDDFDKQTILTLMLLKYNYQNIC